MGRNPMCTVYVGNLDERVTERILYEILIQVGSIVDLYMPLDKETNRHKGFAFAEYENEEIADYAIRLFSGVVRLYNRTVRFAISGMDKPSASIGTPTHHLPHAREMESPRDGPSSYPPSPIPRRPPRELSDSRHSSVHRHWR